MKIYRNISLGVSFAGLIVLAVFTTIYTWELSKIGGNEGIINTARIGMAISFLFGLIGYVNAYGIRVKGIGTE